MDKKVQLKNAQTSSFQSQKNMLSQQTDRKSETSSSDQFCIGVVTFKLGISQKNVQKILKNKKQNIFRKKSWVFHSSKLSQDKEIQFYNQIDSLAISQLEYTQKKVTNILKIVQHIDFTNLKKLSLSCNFITNIQPLGFFMFQNLKYLDLGGNIICQSKSLTKLNLSKLQYLEVCNNPLFELNIGRIRQQSSEVYPRLITFPFDIVFEQICFLAKLQHNVVSCIMEFDLKYFSGQSRNEFNFNGNKIYNKIILQQKVCHSLKKKLMFSQK